MKHYDKLLADAEKELQKYVEREDWSMANLKQGYLAGIFDYGVDVKLGKDVVLNETKFVEEFLKDCLKDEPPDYGDAAYWRAWLNGRMSAETAYRLDELEAMEA